MLPAGTWVKAVSQQGLCKEFKRVNPGLKVVFRYEYTDRQHLQGDYKVLARQFFSSFIDGTFYQQEMYKAIDGIEEWNEYLANSQSSTERAEWVKWCRAVNEVWTQEYRVDPRLAHIKLVSCNTAIGNDIAVDFARIVQQHDGILAYHNYTNVYKKSVTPDDWQYYSGRWTAMDAAYRAAGVTVNWLFTEGGSTIMGTFDGVHYTGVTEGWKHPMNYNGDLNAYIQGTLKYQIDRTSAWNKVNGGRALGHTLFTTSGDAESIWKRFELGTNEWKAIAQFVASYAPPVTPPPPNTTWQQRAWAASVAEQIARGIPLNPNAALQSEIFKAGLVPVHREITVEGRTLQAAESLTGSPARRVYVWEAGKPVTYFVKPAAAGDFTFTHWPTDSRTITQVWGNDPAGYAQYGLPGHEGVDVRALTGTPIYAVANGTVSAINPTENGHNYGIYVRVAHAQSYETTYAHLQRTAVTAGQVVKGGQIIGYADNTGNSNGSHLHLTLKRIGYSYTDEHGTWPHNIFDPTPFMEGIG